MYNFIFLLRHCFPSSIFLQRNDVRIISPNVMPKVLDCTLIVRDFNVAYRVSKFIKSTQFPSDRTPCISKELEKSPWLKSIVLVSSFGGILSSFPKTLLSKESFLVALKIRWLAPIQTI